MDSSEVFEQAVRLLAERLYRTHDSQYWSDHLSWKDFESEAREYVQGMSDAGLLAHSPKASGEAA